MNVKKSTSVELSFLENKLINFFTPFDAVYHYSCLKEFLKYDSMYDFSLKNCKRDFFSIYSVISEQKVRKVYHLINLKKEYGFIPEKFVNLSNQTLCGKIRLLVTKAHIT
jgi:hypothetical protein